MSQFWFVGWYSQFEYLWWKRCRWSVWTSSLKVASWVILCYIFCYPPLSTGTHNGNHTIDNKKTSQTNATHATYWSIPCHWKFLLMYFWNILGHCPAISLGEIHKLVQSNYTFLNILGHCAAINLGEIQKLVQSNYTFLKYIGTLCSNSFGRDTKINANKLYLWPTLQPHILITYFPNSCLRYIGTLISNLRLACFSWQCRATHLKAN